MKYELFDITFNCLRNNKKYCYNINIIFFRIFYQIQFFSIWHSWEVFRVWYPDPIGEKSGNNSSILHTNLSIGCGDINFSHVGIHNMYMHLYLWHTRPLTLTKTIVIRAWIFPFLVLCILHNFTPLCWKRRF